MSVLLMIAGVCFGFGVTIVGVAVMDVTKSVWNKLDLVIGTFAFIVPGASYVWKKKLPFAATFRFNPVPWSTLFFTVVLTLGLVIVTDALDRWIAPPINAFLDGTIGALSPELQSEKILAKLKEEMMISDPISGILLILAAVIGAALCEEMLMRGMFQGALEKKISAAGAIAVSSIVFALIHINPWGGIQIFVLAVFLGFVAWRTKSILPTMIMHGMNNFLVIVFSNADPATVQWYGDEWHLEDSTLIGGIVLGIVGLVGILKNNPLPNIPPGADSHKQM